MFVGFANLDKLFEQCNDICKVKLIILKKLQF